MKSISGWVKQPKPAGGLDHLGSQAPCINIYGRLLPGITNVTDRARYYSFYPWFFWAYEKEFSKINWDQVVNRFRKADCLFTLIAGRHANQTDRDDENHGIAMIGRNTLVKALNKLEDGHPLLLSTYATRESDNPNRYFKNKLGGLGQYYIGTFKDLGLLDGNSKTGVQYTKQRAQEIAEAMDSAIERKLFFDVIKNDRVSTDALDTLLSFCPCQLIQNSAEHANLVDLFFDRKNIFDSEGLQRKNTLCLILHLINELETAEAEKDKAFDHFVFRGAVYSGCLKNEIYWNLPEQFQSTRLAWAIYQKNEMLSVASQAIFWVVLRMIQESEKIYLTSDAFIEDFLKSKEVSKALGKRKNLSFSDAVTDMKSKMPDLRAWENAGHECFLAQQAIEMCSNRKSDLIYDEILKTALDTLIILAAREELSHRPYGSFEFPENYFSIYPINLHSFKYNINNYWRTLSLQELLGWLAHKWGIETHLKVALRKLRRDKLNTFKIRPTEEGLKVTEVPEPGYTAPRFSQGLRILRDIGALELGGQKGSFKLTGLGERILGETIGN
jgi:hypothetical protein